MGRPKLDIDPKVVEQLAMIGCSRREIARQLDCDESVIRRRFAAEFDKGAECGKIHLRRMQWKAADEGNITMQIWLGKQRLGQTDKAEVRMEASVDDQRQQFTARRLAEVDQLLARSRGGGGGPVPPTGNGNGRVVGGNGQGGSIESA